MPAVVKSSVGSLGTSGADGTSVWPREVKKSRNARRSSAAVREVRDAGVGAMERRKIAAPAGGVKSSANPAGSEMARTLSVRRAVTASVDPGQDPPRAPHVHSVFRPELLDHERLLHVHAP